MDNDLIVCRCREVTRCEIIAAIKDGAYTVDGVKRRTRACMGLCQGKSCERIIQSLIVGETGRNPADVLPQRVRMPTRPVKLSVLGDTENG